MKRATSDDCMAFIDKIVSDSLDGASKEDLQAIVRNSNRFVPLNFVEYIFARRLAREASRRLKEEDNE